MTSTTTPSTKLLRHTPPGEASHFDWLVVLDGSVPAPEERAVPCVRLSKRLDLAEAGDLLEGVRLAPHRGHYLRLDAPCELSGGRGLVEPIRGGDVCGITHRAAEIGLQLRWRALAGDEAVLMRVSISPRDDRRGSAVAVRVESRARESQEFEAAAECATREHA